MCQAQAVECNELKEPSTMEIAKIGLDIAKRVFQLHGVDAAGKAVLRRKLQRSEVLAFFKALPPCGLDRADAQTAQQRRQTAPRKNFQTG
jgi:hypothetical protein